MLYSSLSMPRFHVDNCSVVFVCAFFVAAAASILLFAASTRASTVSFYPSTCLGGWQNVDRASGKPDVPFDTPEKITEDNAASVGDQVAELYCGQWKGDVPEDSLPKQFVLKLSWKLAVPQAPAPDDSSVAATGAADASSTVANASSTAANASSTSSQSASVADVMQAMFGDASSTGPVTGGGDASSTAADASSTDSLIATTTDSSDASASPASSTDSANPAVPASGNSSSASSSADTSVPAVPVPVPASTDSSAPNVPAASDPSASAPAPAPADALPASAPTPSPASGPGPQSFLWRLISTPAYADDTATTDISSITAATTSDVLASTTTDLIASTTDSIDAIAPTAFSTSTDDASLIGNATDTLGIAPATTTIDTSDAEPFLYIDYTLDGIHWKPLATASTTNFPREIALPASDFATWDNIENLQVKVRRVATVSPQPEVLLDGMSIETDYDSSAIPLAPDQSSDLKKYHISTVLSSDHLGASVSNDSSQGDLISIVSDLPGSVQFYDDADTSFSMTSGIGDGPLVVPAYDFSPGIISAILTTNDKLCTGMTVDDCRRSPGFRSELRFQVSPTSLTPVSDATVPFDASSSASQ